MKNIFKILCCLVISFFAGFDSQAQSLKILWQHCYGGSADDFGISIVPSPTGYSLFGESASFDGDVHGQHGMGDLWLLSIDSSGNYLNSACYGGSEDDYAQQMNRCLDGGYMLCGSPFSVNGNVTNNHGGCDYWLIKTDENANLQWQKCFGGSCNDGLGGLTVTSDSGFLCGGYTCSTDGDVTGNHGADDFWVIKVDKYGNLKWEKCLGGSSTDWGMCAVETPDGGVICGGWTGSTDGDVNCQHHSEVDAWMVKLDSSRNIDWQKCFGGSGDDVIQQIIPLDDGSYLFLGSTSSHDGDITDQHGAGDFWVGKADHWGNLLWNHCYGGTAYDDPLFIKQLSDGNYIVGGGTKSNDGDVSGNHSFNGYLDMWIIKISPDGVLIWQQCFGGHMHEIMQDAIELPGKRLLLIGSTFTSDNSGDVQCVHHGAGTYDNWLIMVYDSTLVGIPEDAKVSEEIVAFPNPACDFVKFSCKSKNINNTIDILITDQLGRIIKTLILSSGISEQIWDTRNILSGVYCYSYKSGNLRKTGKIVIIKS